MKEKRLLADATNKKQGNIYDLFCELEIQIFRKEVLLFLRGAERRAGDVSSLEPEVMRPNAHPTVDSLRFEKKCLGIR